MCYNLLKSFHDSGEGMLEALQLKSRFMVRVTDQQQCSYMTDALRHTRSLGRKADGQPSRRVKTTRGNDGQKGCTDEAVDFTTLYGSAYAPTR